MAFLRRDGRRPAWAAVLVALCVASGLTWPATAVAGAACPTADGVTVVIDYGRLGAGVQVGCATGLTAASRGSAALQGAGFSWSPPNNTPGFVCRIDGRPTIDETVGSGKDPGYTESCVNTPPGDASWSYWQSSGDGNWSYSNNGITSSRVRIGGFEGWVFGRGDASPPDYRPVTPTPAPAPEPAPTPPPAPTSTTAAAPAPSTTSRSSTAASSSSTAATTRTSATTTTATSTTPTSTTPSSTPPAETEAPTTVPDTATADPTDGTTTAATTPSTTAPEPTPTAGASDTTAATTPDSGPTTGEVDPAAADRSDPDSVALTVLGVAALITVLVVGTVLVHRHRAARGDD